jgi:hypothetical protein
MLRDLANAKLLYLKAVLFLCVCVSSALLLIVRDPQWTTAGLIVLTAWAAARAYYFAFYVIEGYIDPSFRFSGLTSVAKYLWRIRRGK